MDIEHKLHITSMEPQDFGRVDFRQVKQALSEIIKWMSITDSSSSVQDDILTKIYGWDDEMWQIARLAILSQGLAAYFDRVLPGTVVYNALPRGLRDWMAEQTILTGQRMDRMHEDLKSILSLAEKKGISVMPLKGSLLSTIYNEEMPKSHKQLHWIKDEQLDGSTYKEGRLTVLHNVRWRPLADLDLLIRPEEFSGLDETLQKAGYRPERSTRHIQYVHPRANQIVYWGGEHPDNPRPVEVHLHLPCFLLGDQPLIDLTEYFWTRSEEQNVLGQLAVVPHLHDFFVHTALHTLEHLASNEGRAFRWLDLALLSNWIGPLDEFIEIEKSAGYDPHVNEIYVSMVLAARSLPRILPPTSILKLGENIPYRLRQWAENVELDASCGLTMPLPPGYEKLIPSYWRRWRPTQLRLGLIYGDTWLPIALGGYIGRFIKGGYARMTR